MIQNNIDKDRPPDTNPQPWSSSDIPQIHPVLKKKQISLSGSSESNSSISDTHPQFLDEFKNPKHDIKWGAITIWDETSERHSPPPYHHQSQRSSLEELLQRPKRPFSVSTALAGLIMVLFVVFLVATIMSTYYSLKQEIGGEVDIEWEDRSKNSMAAQT